MGPGKGGCQLRPSRRCRLRPQGLRKLLELKRPLTAYRHDILCGMAPSRIGMRHPSFDVLAPRERIPGEKGGADGRKEQYSLAMSEMGQTRRFRDVRDMSGLPQTADISGPGRHFAFVPQADPRRLFDRIVGVGEQRLRNFWGARQHLEVGGFMSMVRTNWAYYGVPPAISTRCCAAPGRSSSRPGSSW